EPSLLLLAARSGNLAVVRRILRAGADVNYRNKDGETALHFAAVKDSPEIARTLIQGGADLNLQAHRTKETPLHQAAIRGKLEVVRELLEHGADCSVKALKGLTARQWAQRYKQKKIVDLLRNWEFRPQCKMVHKRRSP